MRESDWDLDGLTRENRGSYQSASELGLEVADRIINAYLRLDDPTLFRHHDIHYLTSHIDEIDPEEHQPLLDTIIRRLHKADKKQQEGADSLLTPLVTSLHRYGGDQFHLDLRGLRVGQMGKNLEGTKGDPLRVTFTFEENYSFRSLGNGASFCELRVNGITFSVGDYATGCHFLIEHFPTIAGHFSSKNSFYIEDAPSEGRMRKESSWLDLINDNGERVTRFSHDFYKRDNRLFIPDPHITGGWREVLYDGA